MLLWLIRKSQLDSKISLFDAIRIFDLAQIAVPPVHWRKIWIDLNRANINKLFDRFGNCALSQAKSVNQLMLFLYFFSS